MDSFKNCISVQDDWNICDTVKFFEKVLFSLKLNLKLFHGYICKKWPLALLFWAALSQCRNILHMRTGWNNYMRSEIWSRDGS